MKDIMKSSFLRDFSSIIDNMYRLGWDERNGGNISYIIYEHEITAYLNPNKILRKIDFDFCVTELSGMIFLITGTGKFFKNQKNDPEVNCGIIKINEDGKSANLLWGLKDGSGPTSEMRAHFYSHISRLKVDPNHRIIIHTHATNLIAMSLIHDLDECKFSKTLWKMCTECIVVFPEGIGIIPWMIPGKKEIGIITAEKILKNRLVLWPMHGVFGCGSTFDDAFGLIETAEKAAQIYLKISHLQILQKISDEQLIDLADAFNVKPKENYLKSGE